MATATAAAAGTATTRTGWSIREPPKRATGSTTTATGSSTTSRSRRGSPRSRSPRRPMMRSCHGRRRPGRRGTTSWAETSRSSRRRTATSRRRQTSASPTTAPRPRPTTPRFPLRATASGVESHKVAEQVRELRRVRLVRQWRGRHRQPSRPPHRRLSLALPVGCAAGAARHDPEHFGRGPVSPSQGAAGPAGVRPDLRRSRAAPPPLSSAATAFVDAPLGRT